MNLNRFSPKKFFAIIAICIGSSFFAFQTVGRSWKWNEIEYITQGPTWNGIDREPTGRKNIFFIETRSPKDRVGYLVPRQMCSIESAATANPDWDIFLYLLDIDKFRDDEYWKVIESLPNVHLLRINAIEFTRGTPTYELVKAGLKTRSDWLVSHTSDVLRYTILFKYAGVYMDLDIISLKSFNELASNFAGQEKVTDKILAGSAVVGFSDDEVGRRLANAVAQDVAKNFTGKDWIANGRNTLTRGIAALCGTDKYAAVNVEKCEGFRLYPPEKFYAIPWRDNGKFFDPKYFEKAMDLIKDSVVTHLWNHLSDMKTAKKGSHTVLCEVAKKHCPKSFKVGDTFCL